MWNGKQCHKNNNHKQGTVSVIVRLCSTTTNPSTHPYIPSFLSLKLIAEHSQHEQSIHHLFRLINFNNIHDNIRRRRLARHA